MATRLPVRLAPRELTERAHEDEEVLFGYVMPDTAGRFDAGDVENGLYPEDWIDFRPRHPGSRRPIGATVRSPWRWRRTARSALAWPGGSSVCGKTLNSPSHERLRSLHRRCFGLFSRYPHSYSLSRGMAKVEGGRRWT